MFKKDREDFGKKWDDVKVFIEYGTITEKNFMIKLKILLYIKTQM